MATTTKKKKSPASTSTKKKGTTGTRTGKKKAATTPAKKAPATAKKAPAKKAQKVTLRTGPGGHYPYGNKAEREKWEAQGYTVKPTASRAAKLVREGKKAGSILKKEGMAGKRARMAKGALAGTKPAKTTRRKKTGAAKRDPDFQLTAAQKRNLPKETQKGLVAYHKGKK